MSYLLDILYLSEVECLLCNRAIVFNLHNLRIFLKNYAKVIFNGSKPLICHLYNTIRKKIDHIFLDFGLKQVCGFVKESSLYLRPIHVNEFYFEKRASVSSLAFFTFWRNPSLDLPVSGKSIESFDWHIHAIWYCILTISSHSSMLQLILRLVNASIYSYSCCIIGC